MNLGRLFVGKPEMIPCTPYGIMKMFEAYDIDLTGKRAVVIGRSNIVGKPMAQLLLMKNATVTIAHSKTEHLAEVAKSGYFSCSNWTRAFCHQRVRETRCGSD